MIDPQATHAHGDGAVNQAGASVLERTFAVAPDLTVRAARAVLAYALEAGFGPAGRARIGGALADVIDNAVRRGYPSGRGLVHVQAEVRGNELVVTVRDEGVGFEPSALDQDVLARPLHSGLARVAALSDGLAIDSAPGRGTCIVLRFFRTSAAFGEADGVDLSDHDFLAPAEARAVLQALRRREPADLQPLSPALAVVVGRLLAGPNPRALVERALWS